VVGWQVNSLGISRSARHSQGNSLLAQHRSMGRWRKLLDGSFKHVFKNRP
jgi:hypothetical protein